MWMMSRRAEFRRFNRVVGLYALPISVSSGGKARGKWGRRYELIPINDGQPRVRSYHPKSSQRIIARTKSYEKNEAHHA